MSGPSPSTVVAATVATTVSLYLVYTALPKWLFLKPKGKNEAKDANDDLSPAVIVEKLRTVSKLCSDILDDMPWPTFYASLMSLFHLYVEIGSAYPEKRSEMYKKEGEIPSKNELEKIANFLEFADWAYEESTETLRSKLKEKQYELLRHDMALEPGRIGHFIALNHDEKIGLISLKGTSSFADVLTDLLGNATVQDLKSPLRKDGATSFRSHEGIYVAGQLMLDDTQNLVEKMLLPLGYNVVIVGHSLGAGVACLLGLLLKTRITALRNDDSLLKVYAFATPPCMDYNTAIACAPFVTSFVNNTDMVPRCSINNLATLNKLLNKVRSRLEETGMAFDSFSGAQALVSDLMKVDDELLLPIEVFEAYLQEIRDAVFYKSAENALLVPGRVVLAWYRKQSDPEGAGGEPRMEEVDARVADGGMAMLRVLEFENTMIIDHTTAYYRNTLRALLSKTE